MADALNSLLRSTSRSFYLTLRVLPGGVRPLIGLAYLLARTADTIADTEIVPLERRLEALRALREGILGANATRLNLAEFRGKPGPERLLLERVGESLAALQRRAPADRELIRQVLQTITSGQELDLRRFGGATARERAGQAAGRIVALKTDAELDDYIYRVAGCVGEFWTRLCRARLFPNARLDVEQFIAEGIRFGKGLQLVNVLRDLPFDLRSGRCYLPEESLAAFNLSPADLLDRKSHDRFRPLYNGYLDLAEAHLAAGWNYTNQIPFSQPRLRLACAWPLLIGIRTIGRLRAGNVLDAERRIKVSRAELRRIIVGSIAVYPFPQRWRNLLPAAKAVACGGKLT
ncbi:MAG: squalene/phytoene synthase family protein [Verrucomicrobia bacterium]|nr:squalene/phytoene synthase family protein [Verrucomicrobiota bacterium]MDE3099042.1 squalene/phytoene synthase family protein [Verrucomicrobiota bacterium]